MTISWFQAALLGLFACLSSMPGLGGTSFGNYTLGRPLVGGLVCGLILGDIQTGCHLWCSHAAGLHRFGNPWWNGFCGCAGDFLYWYSFGHGGHPFPGLIR